MTIPFLNLTWMGKRLTSVTHTLCVHYMELLGTPLLPDEIECVFRDRSHPVRCGEFHTPPIVISFSPDPEPTFSLSYTVQAQRALFSFNNIFSIIVQMMGAIRDCWKWTNPAAELLTLADTVEVLEPESHAVLVAAVQELHTLGIYTTNDEDNILFRDLLMALLGYNYTVEPSDFIRFYTGILRHPGRDLIGALKMLKDDILHPSAPPGNLQPLHFIRPA